MNPLQAPLNASRDFLGRVFHDAASVRQRRVEINVARKFRPAFVFCAVESVLGLFTICSASSRKSWLLYSMGATLFTVACGHAFFDIRDQKVLDLLSEKLS